MAENTNTSGDDGGTGLDLPDLLVNRGQCCQLSARRSEVHLAGFGEIMVLMLSQEFGGYSFH